MSWRRVDTVAICAFALLLLIPSLAEAAPGGYPPRPPAAPASASAASEVVSNPAVPGLAVNGVVFISEGHGGGFARCSGTSVNSPNLSVVFTAGHCVFDEGRWWSHRWVFVPAYRHGERPYGTFVAKWIGTTPQWLASEDFNYDIGAAVVGRNERGQRLDAAVGGDGIAWGLSPEQDFDVYGYPVARPFNGSVLRRCTQAPYEGHDLASFLMPGPLDLAVPCPVSPGGSGGGWVIHDDVLNSVTSNGYDDDPITDYGPYFGREAGRLFARASRVGR